MRILLTGHNGFIGKNLKFWLEENNFKDLFLFGKENNNDELRNFLLESDYIIHLAGSNRPKLESEFIEVNEGITKKIVNILEENNLTTPIIFTSTTQALIDNPYGTSKKNAEKILKNYSNNTGANLSILRLPNIFGKWAKPNYNSAIATFCHNIARDIDIEIHNKDSELNLLYIDDLCASIINFLAKKTVQIELEPIYESTVGEIAELINKFKFSRENLISENTGSGFARALYSTYLSYLPKEKFQYQIKSNVDDRGLFAEMMKTKDSGQFSFFTAHPGITRGNHYHHTKTEKFLVLEGEALFKFKNLYDDTYFETIVSGDKLQIVESIPGWAHNIKNIGKNKLIVMLWANEIFDQSNPDTIAYEVL